MWGDEADCSGCGYPEQLYPRNVDAVSIGKYVNPLDNNYRYIALCVAEKLGISNISLDRFIDICCPLYVELNKPAKNQGQ